MTAATSALLVVVSWVGISLAELGIFSPAGVGIGSALIGAGWVVYSRSRQARDSGTPGHWPGRELLFLAALSLLALTILYRPAESIFGTHDAGARLNSGVYLAQTGRLFVDDPDHPIADQAGDLVKTLGLYVLDPDRGRIVFQFNGVYEVWVALGYAIVGLASAVELVPALASLPAQPGLLARPLFLYVTPALAVFALWLFFGLGRRLFGSGVGALATLLLAASLPQVAFARFSMSEILTQAFLFVAALAFLEYRDRAAPAAGILAGAAVGCALLTRIDVVLVYAAIGLWVVWLVVAGQLRRWHAYFLVPCGLLLIQAVIHYTVFAPAYTVETAAGLIRVYGRFGVLAMLPLAVLAVLLAVPSIRSRLRPTISGLHHRANVIGAAAIALWAIWALAIRPATSRAVGAYSPSLQQTVEFDFGQNLLLLGAYLGPLALALGLIGLGGAVLQRRATLAPSLLVGLIYLVVFVWNPMITPLHPFWVRRFLPAAIPLLLMLAAWAAIGQESPIRRVHRLAGVPVGLLLLAGIVVPAAPALLALPDYQGSIRQLQAVDGAMPGNAVVIFDPGYAGKWLTLPMTYLFGKNSFTISREDADPARIGGAVEVWTGAGRPVYYVTESGRSWLDPGRWSLTPAVQAHIRFPELEQPLGRLPATSRSLDLSIQVYEVRPVLDPRPPSFPSVVDIGGFDSGRVGSGFYASEGEGRAFRWTRDAAELILPGPPAGCGSRVMLDVAADRPPGIPAAQMKLLAGGVAVGEFSFPKPADGSAGFREVAFDVPPEAARPGPDGYLRLVLQTNAWVPSEHGLGDARPLGVALRTIRIDVGPPCPR